MLECSGLGRGGSSGLKDSEGLGVWVGLSVEVLGFRGRLCLMKATHLGRFRGSEVPGFFQVFGA